MSLEISMRLSDLKILLVLAYDLEVTWEHRTQKHFAMLKAVNETYLMAVLCLSKFIHLPQAFLIKELWTQLLLLVTGHQTNFWRK
jgi:hypothetical protein